MIQPTPSSLTDRQRLIQQIVDRAGELLPSQGPITAFVFLNTLQALEHLPFEEGLKRGAKLFGCQPFLSEDRYRAELQRARIRREDLEAVLIKDLRERADLLLSSLGTLFSLRLAMLTHPMRMGPPEELRWFISETDALTRLRSDVSSEARMAILDETKSWAAHHGPAAVANAETSAAPDADRDCAAVLDRVWAQAKPETAGSWSSEQWEALALRALWQVCRQGVSLSAAPAREAERPIRHRDLLLAVTGKDSDAFVHDVLIRFTAAYADQGFAPWPLPDRDHGYFAAFLALYEPPGGPPDRWLIKLNDELQRIRAAGLNPMQSLEESLELLGVPESEWNDFLTATLLALRGWGGMLRQMEIRSDRVPIPASPGSMIEFLAVRLILERLALQYVAGDTLGQTSSLSDLRGRLGGSFHTLTDLSRDQRAFLVFQLAQVRGWSPPSLAHLGPAEWSALVHEIDAFGELERRRLFHLAFERRFRATALDALSIHCRRPVERVPNPRFQAVFCIDAREESFRRHLEEFAPDTETFGAAGFFGVAMYYRGAADAHFSALCPIVIRPKHWVVEEVVYTFEQKNRRRAATRKAIGQATHQVHVGSRTITGGALLTAGLGVLASIPLVARVLFPRLTARIRQTASSFVKAPPITRLHLERIAAEPGPGDDHIGYSIEEMAGVGERILREIGLTSNFARLVLFLGHGSFCLNNPHKSAYDCGACSGSAGGPNARALAAMLNDFRVREILAQRGLVIPRDTIFLGGQHNTATDAITFFDLEHLPRSHFKDYEDAWQTLEQVCERNAHERCRRFYSAPLNLSYAAARRHVEGRAEDLAQTRPEFGNCTNAMCVVGRRGRTRDLYLDRRSFLVSYDPAGDDADYNILGRILGAVVVVCSGINLQYFFSYIDSPGWGAGTKLPHNITSLLGVMDGAASDLRMGLPWQGVEIHEPVRLLMVIETTPEAIHKIMERNPTVGNILRNGWIQLVLLDPASNSMLVYRQGEFHPYQPEASELPKVKTSIDWYRGYREHLPFAVLDPATT